MHRIARGALWALVVAAYVALMFGLGAAKLPMFDFGGADSSASSNRVMTLDSIYFH